MTVAVRDASNSSRPIPEVIARDAGNTPRTIQEIRVRETNNVSRIVYSVADPLSVDVSPIYAIGDASGSETGTTSAVTATAAGGYPPYTYAWSVISYSAAVSPIINSPTSNVTTITQTGVPLNDGAVAELKVVVTDAQSQQAEISFSASWTNFSGGYIP